MRRIPQPRAGGGTPVGERTGRLAAEVEQGAVAEVLSRALRAMEPGTGTVRLVGRFAAEAVGRPGSEVARFVRGEVLPRGHRLRLLLPPGVARGEGVRELLARMSAEEVEVRVSASVPLPGLAFLGSELALVHTGAGQGRPQVLLAFQEAVLGLQRIQQDLWEHARELSGERAADTGGLRLDPTQAEVLRMLGAGMKDDAAARQMNVSVRTYRRHVAAILKHLEVDSRFEAGLRVAELGLLRAS
ncbi:hypothetical protein Kpho02_55770 [Kitasatospora phosalacinea]|uniref:HTH luxR-type domain-containing protein n=1 Tax=Kitasatospora phosalacinea TaxID=2065 RepID=A0A9W6V4H1_9ACTN|nr:LuxR C-terminal-related transcriptional regulator [Kitasatospora phosalacinea]GLW73278.1 hypothetical protein Kpho02_55770 [Kitasatospora phosalacinea]